MIDTTLLNEVDLLVTPEGDLVRTEEGDLATTTGVAYFSQQIRNRLENVQADWFYDVIGADLEDLLGMPNEQQTATQGEQMVRNALVDLVPSDDLLVQAVPVGKTTLLLFVFINLDDVNPLGFEVTLALGSHVEVREV